jgi:hypothetical protein
MSNYTAADMSTAASNGHRDGYQAGYADAVKAVETGKPPAAQGAVAWRYRHPSGTGSWHPWVMVSDEPKNKYPTSEYEPLYAAPVAAAPVCPSCAASLLYECVGCSVSNYPNTSDSPVDTWFADQLTAMGEVMPLDSTPAAPGINRESIGAEVRRLVNVASQYAQPMPGEPQCLVISMAVADAVIREAVEAGARIDASPKGGSDAARLDALEKLVDDSGALLLHHGCESGRGFNGLGLRNTGRTLRQAIDQATSAEVGE